MTSNGATGATGKATGYWKEEFAAPYYAFIDAGVEVTIASPAGARACVRRAGSERVGVRACVRFVLHARVGFDPCHQYILYLYLY